MTLSDRRGEPSRGSSGASFRSGAPPGARGGLGLECARLQRRSGMFLGPSRSNQTYQSAAEGGRTPNPNRPWRSSGAKGARGSCRPPSPAPDFLSAILQEAACAVIGPPVPTQPFLSATRTSCPAPVGRRPPGCNPGTGHRRGGPGRRCEWCSCGAGHRSDPRRRGRPRCRPARPHPATPGSHHPSR